MNRITVWSIFVLQSYSDGLASVTLGLRITYKYPSIYTSRQSLVSKKFLDRLQNQIYFKRHASNLYTPHTYLSIYCPARHKTSMDLSCAP